PPPAFDDLAALQEALERWMPLQARLLAFATGAVAQRLTELKQRQQVFGFADPLRRLDAALAGPDGDALRARLLARYPVALIDEFQDTSPLQWRVFERLYVPNQTQSTADAAIAGPPQDRRTPSGGGPGTPGPGGTMLLIGDPKQSIYGFRGADIYSYLLARRATAGRHYALDTNHRSTAALVGCVNALFAHAEQAGAQGAFALGKGQAMALPFVPVQARGRAERLVAGGAPVPAFTLCHDATLFKANDLRRHHATLAAEQVVAWLGQAHFERDGQAPQRLQPADIAVLVRNRAEAQAVRRALEARGVRSVYLSDQSSVFDTPEALDLWRWLQAVAQPLDAGLARAAFATTTIGLSWQELAAHAQDEAAWDRRVELLRELQRVWQRQGVLAMLRQALHRLGLPARLLAQSGGERSLTNLLHLAELLQGAGVVGEAALVRWLGERITESQDGTGDGAGLGDERIVRLESDEGLVQVITVHKSKGLEYPVVMLPFAASLPRDVKDRVLSLADPASGERRLVFAPGPADKAAEQAERLREDLRLLYVALTRARHALWLGVGLQKDRYASEPLFHRSALGHLVVDGQPTAAVDLAGRLRTAFGPWAGDAAGVRWVGAELPPQPGRWLPEQAEAPLAAVPVFAAVIDRDWAVGSYSAMVRGLAAPADAQADAAADATEPTLPSAAWTPWLRDDMAADRGGASDETAVAADAEAPTGSFNEPAVSALASAPWHRFPRGALPGNFLHDQLQWLAEEGFDRLATDSGRQALRRRCERAGHGERADDVVAWLQAVVTTPLPPLGAALVDLRVQVSELEFWLPSAALDAPALDALVQAHLLPGVSRPALPARRLRGLLMGFADLVFEHAGRWWVLDYKSNALTPRDGGAGAEAAAQHRAYRAPVLAAAMAEHRYDVQAALYMAALHRLLRVRLGAAYDPARHLGGAVYLFLRGIAGPQRGCVWLPAPPGLLQGIDAMLDVRENSQEGVA
ncbi:MAG: 3'-5' exonuclease, partial [Burkholderiales bacterium]